MSCDVKVYVSTNQIPPRIDSSTPDAGTTKYRTRVAVGSLSNSFLKSLFEIKTYIIR